MVEKTVKEIEWERSQLKLQYAADTRKFEIQLFWQRSLYFWGFVLASLVAYSALDQESDRLARTATICFGFLTSVAWSLQNRGSKYWQEAWEQKVEKAQTAVLGQDLFKHKEDLLPKSEDRNWRHHWLRARRYSVSKLAIAMSDLAVFLWLFLASLDSNADLKASVDYPKTSLYVGSLLFAAAISYFGLSNEKLKPPHLT